MSADPSFSQAAEEEAPRPLMDEVHRLARAELAPRAFYRELLEQAVRSLEAVGGAVWLRNAADEFQLDYQINLDATHARSTPENREYHDRLLAAACEEGDLRIVSPAAGLPGRGQAANPTKLLMIVAPVRRDEELHGVVELFFQPGTPAVQQTRADALAKLCAAAGDYHRHGELRELRRRAELWGQFEQFAARVHGSLNVKSTAYQIANDGRIVIGCDRLSVAVRRRRRCRIAAVSGLDRFDRRSAHVRGLQRLIDGVVRTGEPLCYLGDFDDLPPQQEGPLQKFLDQQDQTDVRQLLVVPLYQPSDEESPNKRSPVIGVLAAECYQADPNPDGLRQRVTTVARHGQAALSNAMTYESVPFLPLLRLCGSFLRPKRFSLAVLAVGLLAAAAAALVLVPGDFEIEARGELQPAERRNVFAPHEGTVTEVHVRHGQQVRRRDPADPQRGLLAKLDSSELNYEVSKVLGEVGKAEKRLRTISIQVLQLRNPRSTEEVQERDKLAAEAEELKKLLASLREQQKILQRQQAEMAVYSPIDGEVLTWNVQQTLDHKPVQHGQLLLKIADLNGEWLLELHVPDHHIGHVLDAKKESGEPLSVEFVLATAPETTYRGRIKDVAMTTEPHDVHGSSVMVTVSLDGDTRNQLPDLRPGATVIGRIACGRRPLGYVWFHDLIDAVTTWVWF